MIWFVVFVFLIMFLFFSITKLKCPRQTIAKHEVISPGGKTPIAICTTCGNWYDFSKREWFYKKERGVI